MRPNPPKKKPNMGSRKLRADIRRNMTTALQHGNAALRLATEGDVPDSIYFALHDVIIEFRIACKDCRPWWKNA